MHIRSLMLALPLFAAVLPAQTAAPVATDLPHVVIDTVGPDGWRMRFGPTNLGSLLESEKGRTMWEPQVMPMLGMWQQLVGDEAAFAAARARLLGHGGRIRIGVWFDGDGMQSGKGPQHAAIVVDGDGRSDLAALANDVRELQTKTMPGEWIDVDVAGAKVPTRQDGDDVITAPLAEGGRLTIAYARDGELAAALARARTLAADFTGKPPAPNTPALRMQFDIAGMVKLSQAKEAASERGLMTALGVDSLGTATMVVGTAGPHVQVEVAQQFTSEQRGLFGIFFPASVGITPLLHAAAANPGSWKVGRFDLGQLYKVIEDASVAEGQGTPEKVREEMTTELGIDLEKDLLAHLTDEVLLLGSPLMGLDEVAEATWALAIRLRDEAAFTKGLLTMMPKAKPLFSREAEEKHGDIPVYRYGGMFGYDLWLSVGNGVFVLAGGRDAEEQLGLLLDRGKDLPKEPPAAVAGFEALQKFLPAGTNGLAVGDIGSVFMLPSELWFGLLGEFTPLPGRRRGEPSDPDQRDAILALLKEHKLDVVRSATGFHEKTWRWRMFW